MQWKLCMQLSALDIKEAVYTTSIESSYINKVSHTVFSKKRKVKKEVNNIISQQYSKEVFSILFSYLLCQWSRP